MAHRRPFLVLIPGDKDMVGPVTRLGIRKHLSHPKPWQWAMVLVTKLILLATVVFVARSMGKL